MFDVNQDGIIDLNDQTLLEQSLAGQDVSLLGDFAPTGIFAELDTQRRRRIAAEQQAARIAADAQTERQRALEQQAEAQQAIEQQIQQQIEQQIQSEQNISNQIEATRQREAQERLLQQAILDPGITATPDEIPLANIDYLYDIGGRDIFAPTNRTQRFSPYGASNVVPARQSPVGQPLQGFLPQTAAKGGIINRNAALLKLIGDN